MSKIGKRESPTNGRLLSRSVPLLVVLSISMGCGFSQPSFRLGGLGDTSYKLVEFTGRDGTVTLRDEDEKSKYTVAFTNDGKVKVRFDCESGHGTWTLIGRNQLVFGPLTLSRLFGATRRVCSPESLHDQLVRHWPLIRSYTFPDGSPYLVLSGLEDGSAYYFETIYPFWRMGIGGH